MAVVAENTQVFMMGMPSMEHCGKLKIGIVAAEWNDNVIAPLLQGAIDTLAQGGRFRTAACRRVLGWRWGWPCGCG